MTVNCLLIHPATLHLSEQPPLQFPPSPSHHALCVPVFLFALSQSLHPPLPHLIQSLSFSTVLSFVSFFAQIPRLVSLFRSLHLATPQHHAALPPLFSVHSPTPSIFPLFLPPLFTQGLILPLLACLIHPTALLSPPPPSYFTPAFICFSTCFTFVFLHPRSSIFILAVAHLTSGSVPCLSSYHPAPSTAPPLPFTIYRFLLFHSLLLFSLTPSLLNGRITSTSLCLSLHLPL